MLHSFCVHSYWYVFGEFLRVCMCVSVHSDDEHEKGLFEMDIGDAQSSSTQKQVQEVGLSKREWDIAWSMYSLVNWCSWRV